MVDISLNFFLFFELNDFLLTSDILFLMGAHDFEKLV